MNSKPVLILSATLMFAAQTCAIAEENKRWKDQETWYEYSDKEQHHGFKNPKAQPHAVAAPGGQEPQVAPPIRPNPAPDNDAISVPYILQQGPEAPPPARNIITETVEPVLQPGALAAPYWSGISPYYAPGGWVQPRMWSGARQNWGFPQYQGGLPLPPGVYPLAPAVTFQPTRRVIQTGRSKASGNYFNPSTPDSTAAGGYYAPSGNTPRAVPVYQPEAQPKDYWGPQGSPLPPEMQP